MKVKVARPKVIAIGLLLLMLAGAYGIHTYVEWKRSEDRLAIWHMVNRINRPLLDENGYWVGDVAELYRLAKLPREMAEADVAPLHPLVPSPIPYHGYFVRVLETGPARWVGEPPTSLKGKTRCRDSFAICIYPAEEGADEYTWLLCPYSILRMKGRKGPPITSWPEENERRQWSIVD